MNFLAGWKSYLVSAIMVLSGAGSLVGLNVPGIETTYDPVQLIMEGLGLSALRKGISG